MGVDGGAVPVTGAARGIGAGIGEAFTQIGVRVVSITAADAVWELAERIFEQFVVAHVLLTAPGWCPLPGSSKPMWRTAVSL